MTNKEAERILVQALCKLKGELCTFGKTIGESPLVFRIAHYVACEAERENITVDCDYNRRISDIKTFRTKKWTLPDGRKSLRFFPDIVLHQRKRDDRNILVCEVKKKGDRRGRECDHQRLKILTCRNGGFGYSVGAFVEVDQQESRIRLQWFRGGAKDGEETI